MNDTAPPPTRPPTRGAARRQAFLEAATEVFLEEGYEAASVNEVVRRAGGSLATLYAQFGSKEGLFLAVVEDSTERFAAVLAQTADHRKPLAEGLQEIGERWLEGILQPLSLGLFRILVSEGRKFPAMMERFLASGPERVRAAISAYLMERGPVEGLKLSRQDADFLGASFCDMLRATHQYRALASPTYVLTEEQQRAHVARAVRFLLDGARPRPAAP